jgi:hypothetical protein
MAELNGKKLRTVQLEEVARYLECNPKKLCIALRHLAAVPTAIQYSKDAGVMWGVCGGARNPTLDTRPVDPQAAKWLN